MKYKLLNSILKYENKEILVSLRDWAKLTFSEEKYQKFFEDLRPVDSYYQKFVNYGIRIETPIFEQVYFNNTPKEVQIGMILEHKIHIKTPPILDYYRDQFKNDPNVIYSEIEEIPYDKPFYPHFSSTFGKHLYVCNYDIF